MNILKIFNEENITAEELKYFKQRRATRGVVFDTDNKVALLNAGAARYYGLPGGGVEEGETYEEGIIRECKEEIGCNITLAVFLGRTLEYTKIQNIINETWSYTAHVVGDKGERVSVETDNQIDKNTTVMWVSLDEAIHLMKSNPQQKNLYSQYYIDRDLLILEKVKVMKTKIA